MDHSCGPQNAAQGQVPVANQFSSMLRSGGLQLVSNDVHSRLYRPTYYSIMLQIIMLFMNDIVFFLLSQCNQPKYQYILVHRLVHKRHSTHCLWLPFLTLEVVKSLLLKIMEVNLLLYSSSNVSCQVSHFISQQTNYMKNRRWSASFEEVKIFWFVKWGRLASCLANYLLHFFVIIFLVNMENLHMWDHNG